MKVRYIGPLLVLALVVGAFVPSSVSARMRIAYWFANRTKAYYNVDFVGIGTDNPTSNLHVTELYNGADILTADSTEVYIAVPLSLGSDLTVGGNLQVDGTTMLGGQVTIDALVGGGELSYGAYPLRVEGSDQGIAIEVNGSRSVANNFVSFWDVGGMQGRIEGQTVTDLLTDPEYIFQNGVLVAQEAIAIADEVAALTSSTVGATTTPPPIPVVTSPIPSLIAQATANLATQTAQLVGYNAFKLAQIGVTYQSSAGDYAEWLPKATAGDKFYPGDIVGVRGGRISSTTDGAEQLLVISTRPAVLANMPEEGTESAYEKVAFMGQVPVKVMGKVRRGDYILPSGRNDGFGKAVAVGALRAEQYGQIVGVAWSESEEDGFSYVIVAVGLHTNAVSRMVRDQAAEIAHLRRQIADSNRVLAELVPGYAESLASLQPASTDAESDATTASSSAASRTDDGPSSVSRDGLAYQEITRADLAQAFQDLEAQMRASGQNVDEHPLFKKLRADPEYRERLISGLVQRYNEWRSN